MSPLSVFAREADRAGMSNLMNLQVERGVQGDHLNNVISEATRVGAPEGLLNMLSEMSNDQTIFTVRRLAMDAAQVTHHQGRMVQQLRGGSSAQDTAAAQRALNFAVSSGTKIMTEQSLNHQALSNIHAELVRISGGSTSAPLARMVSEMIADEQVFAARRALVAVKNVEALVSHAAQHLSDSQIERVFVDQPHLNPLSGLRGGDAQFTRLAALAATSVNV